MSAFSRLFYGILFVVLGGLAAFVPNIFDILYSHREGNAVDYLALRDVFSSNAALAAGILLFILGSLIIVSAPIGRHAIIFLLAVGILISLFAFQLLSYRKLAPGAVTFLLSLVLFLLALPLFSKKSLTAVSDTRVPTNSDFDPAIGAHQMSDQRDSQKQNDQGGFWETFKSALGYDFFLPPGVVGEPASRARRAAAALLGSICFYAAVGLYRFTFDGAALTSALSSSAAQISASLLVPAFWVVVTAAVLFLNDRKADFAHVFRTAFLFNIFMFTIGKIYHVLSASVFR